QQYYPMIQKRAMHRNLLVRSRDGKIVQTNELYPQSHQRSRPVHGKRDKSWVIIWLVKQAGIAGFEQNPFFSCQLQSGNIAGSNLPSAIDSTNPRGTDKQLQRQRLYRAPIRHEVKRRVDVGARVGARKYG